MKNKIIFSFFRYFVPKTKRIFSLLFKKRTIDFEALEYNYLIEIDDYLKRKNVLEKSNIRFFKAIFKKRLILN